MAVPVSEGAAAARAEERLDAAALLDIVERALHPRASEWLFFRELKAGTGRRNGSEQRLDGFALNTLPHTAMKRVCYEVKVSRSDFLAELKRPLKRRVGMRYSNEFYFVAPAGLIGVAEVPSECGLIEAGRCDAGQFQAVLARHAGFFSYDPETCAYCVLTVPAPWRDTPGPSWQFAAAMVRNHRRMIEGPPSPPPAQARLELTAALDNDG